MAAADTVMTRPSADLMAEVFPTVPLRRPVEGRETLLAIDRARRLLGYATGPPLGGPRPPLTPVSFTGAHGRARSRHRDLG